MRNLNTEYIIGELIEITASDDLNKTHNNHVWSLVVEKGGQTINDCSDRSFYSTLLYAVKEITEKFQAASIAIPANTLFEYLSPFTVSEAVARAFAKYTNFPDVQIFFCVDTMELGQDVAGVIEDMLLSTSEKKICLNQKNFYREKISQKLFVKNGMYEIRLHIAG